MGIGATIHTFSVQLADVDRGVYETLSLKVARHPSESAEYLVSRVLAYALNAPASTDHGALELAKSLWDVDEPDLWQKDLTGQVTHWIDVGQPDERRILRASPRAERVTVISFASSTPVWWSGIASKITRARNVAVWQIEAAQSQALAALAQRSMQLQVSVQDGTAYVSEGTRTVEITPVRLNPV